MEPPDEAGVLRMVKRELFLREEARKLLARKWHGRSRLEAGAADEKAHRGESRFLRWSRRARVAGEEDAPCRSPY
jgi:hypothetical protein